MKAASARPPRASTPPPPSRPAPAAGRARGARRTAASGSAPSLPPPPRSLAAPQPPAQTTRPPRPPRRPAWWRRRRRPGGVPSTIPPRVSNPVWVRSRGGRGRERARLGERLLRRAERVRAQRRRGRLCAGREGEEEPAHRDQPRLHVALPPRRRRLRRRPALGGRVEQLEHALQRRGVRALVSFLLSRHSTVLLYCGQRDHYHCCSESAGCSSGSVSGCVLSAAGRLQWQRVLVAKRLAVGEAPAVRHGRDLGEISTVSRLDLGEISTRSRRDLGDISARSRRHLGDISATSRRGASAARRCVCRQTA